MFVLLDYIFMLNVLWENISFKILGWTVNIWQPAGKLVAVVIWFALRPPSPSLLEDHQKKVICLVYKWVHRTNLVELRPLQSELGCFYSWQETCLIILCFVSSSLETWWSKKKTVVARHIVEVRICNHKQWY